MRLRGWAGPLVAASALLLVAVPRASAQLRLGLAPVRVPVLAVVDPNQTGRAINPFREECIVRLAVLDADGAIQQIDDDEATRDGVRLYPAGRRAQEAGRPAWVNVTDGGIIEVALAPENPDAAFQVLLPAATLSGTTTAVADLETEPFTIPRSEGLRCGATPRVSVDVQDPTGDSEGLALGVDIVRRSAFSGARGGMWELFVEGLTRTSENDELLNTWKAGGRVEIKLNDGYAHWISLGATARVEASEDWEVVDKVVGAALRVRLDFLQLDQILTPLLAGYTPYPMVVIEYDHITRDESVPAGVTAGPPIDHRLQGRLDWSVPLLFETTLRVKLRGDLFLGDLPAGVDERWRPLADVALEYPLNDAGDIRAVITRLTGETAPLYESVSRYLIGVGLRR